MTYGTTNLSFITNQINNNASTKPRIEIWGVTNPPLGTANVVVTFSAGTGGNAVGGVVTFTNVDQINPLRSVIATSSGSATTSPALATVASATGDLVFDTVSMENSTATPGATQTQYWNATAGGIQGAGSTASGAASATMSWTNTAVRWVEGAFRSGRTAQSQAERTSLRLPRRPRSAKISAWYRAEP